jgi:molybdate-binding protein/DNA-binding XRE family transcriptional regulator
MSGSQNRVRELRQTRALSQIDLARSVGLTRQSVHAIESGRAIPAVDVALRLASALACPVEALFGSASGDPRLSVEPVGRGASGRVALSYIAGRWLSYPLDGDCSFRSADGVTSKSSAGGTVDLLRASAETRENLVIMGCAPALGLLADRLNTGEKSGRFLWFARPSTEALSALGRKRAHIAGAHLVDARSGESNVPYVRRHVADRALVVITLASWQAGIVLPPANPKRITQVSDLARKGLRLVTRQPGSGAQLLLERELKRAGVPLAIARTSAPPAAGHLEVAQAVAMGFVDAGVASHDAALAFGLAFVPLADERFDLVIPRDDLEDARVARLLDVMAGAAFRREIAALGYDVTRSGDRVAEIAAA